MSIITIKNLTKRYPMGSHFFTALSNVTLEFEKGEFCGLIGPSGSGKTTLLNIIGALDAPTEGNVVVINKNVENLSHKESAALRNHHIGFIFQTYNLFPVYSVYENIEFPLLLLKMPPKERRQKVYDALEWLRLTDKVNSKPAQLSGGECQRVAVARAVVKRPALILADEPTANLDSENSYNILEMMVRLNKELETTFIFATHDEKVMKYLRRKIHLFDGHVARDEIIAVSSSEVSSQSSMSLNTGEVVPRDNLTSRDGALSEPNVGSASASVACDVSNDHRAPRSKGESRHV
ncbi:ABC transporter ATP-binding protein [Aminobacterium sp. UBA5514]|uniref:ABC transporter ATP-binding protein n=1 Tax=Aminobacterium sp. UBA5514 TaxID=1946036 RepID=UPI00257C7D0F|nr:ABC transporter ATP-binding protein [Aminobacterium sp. UBA5514]